MGVGVNREGERGGGGIRLISLANEKRTFGRLNINILPNFDPVEKEENNDCIYFRPSSVLNKKEIYPG